MKKAIIVLLVALLAMNVTALGGAEVKASILRHEPTPAEQGNTFDVWIQLSNAGTKAERVAVKFEPEYPFSLPAGQQQEVDVGVLAATEDKVVKYTIFADPAAPNGENEITFLYKYSTFDDWIQLEAPITLETQDATLVVDEYTVQPSLVAPGSPVEIKMILRNAGRTAIKNLDVEMALEDKFSTIDSGTKKRIDYIGAGEQKEVSFKLASDTTTEVKLYSIPVKLDYRDTRNKEYEDEVKLSIAVNAEPELALTVDETDFEDKDSAGEVSLQIVNKGVVDLKYVTVTLIKTPDYEILSPSNEEYVGNLDNDDFENVQFMIKPLVESPRLAVKLDFKDPYNIDFTRNFDLPLRIITAKDLGKQKFPFVTVIIILAVVGIVYWKYFRRKK